jgi:hypothetical protein
MGLAFIVREVATTDHASMCCSLVVVGVVVVVGFAFIASYLKLLLLFSIVVRFTTHSPTQSSIRLPTGSKKQNSRISFPSVCRVKFNEVVRQEQAFNTAVPLISLRSFMHCTNFFSYAACSGDFHETQAAAAH